jgi:hypothetical protein
MAADHRTTGAWEFAPAAVAGPYSRGGPTRRLRSLLARRNVTCGLTFQAAAWALGAADRAPLRIEVAVANERDVRWMPDELDVSVYCPQLPYRTAKGVPTLQPASVLTHMASTPARVRSWSSALEWLPDIAAEITIADARRELQGRPATVGARLGYLLQDCAPTSRTRSRNLPPRRGSVLDENLSAMTSAGKSPTRCFRSTRVS